MLFVVWENDNGVRARLWPDQNGCPDDVFMCGGKLCNNCFGLFAKISSNFNRAHSIHCSNVVGLSYKDWNLIVAKYPI